MSLTRNQAKFASVFARETGLNPKVVGAWMLAEQSGSAAQFYERKGYNNWLNIARTDSGDAKGAHAGVFRNPESAAKASADWIRGRGEIANSYGKPAGGITAILKTAGQGPHRQIQAIARSGWASSGYNGGHTLSQLLGQTGDIPVSGATMARSPFRAPAEQSTTTLNQQGLSQAQQHVNAVHSVASLFTGDKPGDKFLRETLENVPAPSPEDFTSTSVAKTPTGTYYTPHAEGRYVHPLPHATIGRTDQGVDMSAKPGTPIRAIGDSKVLEISPNWYKGQPYVSLELLSGPHRGKVYFVAEQIAPHVHPGQFVRGGHAIGHVAPHGTALEIGWGSHKPGGMTKAKATTGYTEGQETDAGKDFARFLRGLK